MTSWRDGTPQPVQEDLDRLHGTALGWALHTLGRHRHLLPVALSLGEDGELESHAAAGARDTHDALGRLSDALNGIQDRLRATALVMDTTWQGGDAVRIDLAHREAGVDLRVRTPYLRRRRLLRWRVEIAEAVVEVTEPHGWA